MSAIRISHPTKKIEGVFQLPSSKSISNRLLILQALSDNRITIQNLSDADDSQIMQEALKNNKGRIDVKNAGTCMRFLTAYYACTDSDVILHGNERMHERPIGELVNALRQLGADIDYLDKEGFPPLVIKGKKLKGGKLQIDASSSSQFITALMLIAPVLENGLTIELTGNIVSESYLQMTERLMYDCGLLMNVQDRVIDIPPQTFSERTITVEADWSAASYWYAMAALSKDCHIRLPLLTNSYLQGDIAVVNYMEQWGVHTSFEANEAVLTKTHKQMEPVAYDMNDIPDLVPTMAVALAALYADATFENIAHLRIKESNRIQALENELKKLGFDVESENDLLHLITTENAIHSIDPVQTYGDHRMAMSFAALALVFDSITIEDPEVVEKSYPQFWRELKKAGFVITEL